MASPGSVTRWTGHRQAGIRDAAQRRAAELLPPPGPLTQHGRHFFPGRLSPFRAIWGVIIIAAAVGHPRRWRLVTECGAVHRRGSVEDIANKVGPVAPTLQRWLRWSRRT
jgi:hypothetical protein